MSTYIEQVFGQGLMNSVGDPAILGILVLAFFGIFVVAQNTRLDGKVMILLPASILVMLFIPWWGILIIVVFAFILWRAWLRHSAG